MSSAKPTSAEVRAELEKPDGLRRVETEPEGGDLWWAPVLRVGGSVAGAWRLIRDTVPRRRRR